MALAIILEWACRLFLGGLFIVAGYAKLANRFEFELAIESYQILSVWGVIAVAHTLPWLEVILGLFLVRGWKLHWFATAAAALLGFFLAIMAITYSRGVEATCGCFGLGEPVSPRTLLRDTLFFLPAVYLSIAAWHRFRLKRIASSAVASGHASETL